MGTPDFAVPALSALLEAGHEVAAVYSQPPRPAGRGHKEQPSPVHRFADEKGLDVRHPVGLRSQEEKDAFAALELDVAVVAAYGLILPKAILEAPKLGCLNIHGSLLPRWRGAAPIQRAILAGDTETGVTIMGMERGLDTGPMGPRRVRPITPQTTASALHDRLAADGADLIVDAVERLGRGELTLEPQPQDGVTYAEKIEKADGVVAWRSAEEVDRQVRALVPWPGVTAQLETEALKLHGVAVEPGREGAPAGEILDDRLLVACADGSAVRITRLQRPGKAPMDAEALLRGHPIAARRRFAVPG